MTDDLREALEPFVAEARKHVDTLDDGRRVALFLSPEQCRRLAAAVAAREQVNASGPLVNAPEGWVLTPADPTPEMCQQGGLATRAEKALCKIEDVKFMHADDLAEAEGAYRAMLAARPAVAVPGGVGESSSTRP